MRAAIARARKRWGRKAGSLLAVGAIAYAGAFAGNAGATHTSSDVATGTFFHEHIGWLIEQGIANGFPDGTFKPKDSITREQMAFWVGNFSDELELVSSVAIASGTLSFLASFTICPAGKRALMGSGQSTTTDVFITDSFPSSNHDRWPARWEKEGDVNIPNPAEFTVWVLCGPEKVS